MKKQIRRGVFETNSSSVHSLSFCTEEEFEKIRKEEVYLSDDGNVWTLEKIFAEYPEAEAQKDNEDFEDILRDYYGFATWRDYGGDYYEKFWESYSSPSGDKVVAFGYYGTDY